MKKNTLIAIAGIYGFIGVAFGAFGAHALKDSLSPEMIEMFKTATYYNLIHTAVIFVIGMVGSEKYYKSGFILSIGVFLFSFSLYAYAITDNALFAIITPFGGVSFLIGWILIIWQSIKKKN